MTPPSPTPQSPEQTLLQQTQMVVANSRENRPGERGGGLAVSVVEANLPSKGGGAEIIEQATVPTGVGDRT